MPGIFWTAIVTLTLVAFGFVMRPFLHPENRLALAVIAIGLPTFAATLYLTLGAPSLANPAVASPAADRGNLPASHAGRDDKKAGSISSLVDGLAARLEDNPDDGGSWLLLAKSYRHLNRLDEARNAYAKAVALGESDEELAAVLNGESPHAAVAAGNNAAAAGGISGTVSLSAEAADVVRPDDTVFIFARAAGQAGAPAAVVQTTAAEWPIRFRLTDANSMMSGVKLSAYDEVFVTARVSRSGNAGDALRGLEAVSGPVAVDNGQAVELVLQ